MKIHPQCRSILLQESLKHYLKDNLSDLSDCDFVISDMPDVSSKTQKPVCIIGSSPNDHVKKPFNEKTLFEDLAAFYRSKVKVSDKERIIANPMPENLLKIGNEELKTQIDSLLEEFSKKIWQTLKKHEK